jgi:hypothetical protein
LTNNRKLERVARAICFAAGTEFNNCCVVCDPDRKHTGSANCQMVDQFKREAEAAIKATKGF